MVTNASMKNAIVSCVRKVVVKDENVKIVKTKVTSAVSAHKFVFIAKQRRVKTVRPFAKGVYTKICVSIVCRYTSAAPIAQSYHLLLLNHLQNAHVFNHVLRFFDTVLSY